MIFRQSVWNIVEQIPSHFNQCCWSSEYLQFLIFSFSLLSQHLFRGDRGFKVFAFEIVKVFLAVPVGFYMSWTSVMEEFYKELQASDLQLYWKRDHCTVIFKDFTKFYKNYYSIVHSELFLEKVVPKFVKYKESQLSKIC